MAEAEEAAGEAEARDREAAPATEAVVDMGAAAEEAEAEEEEGVVEEEEEEAAAAVGAARATGVAPDMGQDTAQGTVVVPVEDTMIRRESE